MRPDGIGELPTPAAVSEVSVELVRRGRRRGSGPITAATEGEGVSVLPLYTPAAAAQLLSVRESWLRRRAAARTVPCTFVGKHLRFSHADLVAIAAAGATPPAGHRMPGSAVPGRRRPGRRPPGLRR